MSGEESDQEADADLRWHERRMRAQLANIVTVQTASLANIPSLDSLTDEERGQMERMLHGDDSGHSDLE